MLIKKKLLQIPPKACPNIEPEEKSYHRELLAAVQVVDRIVVVDLYDTSRKLVERFFADGNTWQYFDVVTGTWNQRTNSDYSYAKDWYLCTEIPDEVFKILDTPEYDRRNCNGRIDHILVEYTTEKYRTRREAAKERMYAKIRRIEEESFHEPAGLARWCLLHVFPAYSMIFPKAGKKTYTVRCLCCGHEGQVKTIRHKESWKCPKCRRSTTAYKQQYITSIGEKENIAVWRKTKEIIAVTGSAVYRHFDGEGKQQIRLVPFAIYHRNAQEEKYLYESLTSWYGFKYAKFEIHGDFYIYPGNLKHVFPDGKYEGIDMVKMKGMKVPLFQILKNREDKRVKDLCRIGCYSLSASVHSLNEGKTFAEVTGIDQNYVTEFRKHNYGYRLVATIQKIDEIYHRRGTYNSEQLEKLSNMNAFGIADAAKHMTDMKLINYFAKQMKLYPKQDFSTITGWYDDYINAIEFLSSSNTAIDTTASIVRFPRELKKAHDTAMDRQQNVIDEEGNKKLMERSDEYAQIEVQDNKFVIKHPTCRKDLVAEGTSLSHCIGNSPQYFEKQVTGEFMSFFIRKKTTPDKPYYTATIKFKGEEPELKECHGLGHKAPTKEVERFLEKYLEAVSTCIKSGLIRNFEGSKA